MTSDVIIRDFKPEDKTFFEHFNRQWIEEFFTMEPVDHDVLTDPEKHILSKGGTILMACDGGKPAGTVALKYVAPGVFEFTKMAVDIPYRGKNIGKALCLGAIERARLLGAKRIILYSNTVLAPAIALYRSVGFKELPVDGPYKRSNIKMVLEINND